MVAGNEGGSMSNVMDVVQKRWAAQREQTRQEILALGYRVISCVSFYDPRDQKCLRTSYNGETCRVVLTNAPPNPARFGIRNILVGPDSKVVAEDDYADTVRSPNDVFLVVFSHAKVIDP